MRALIGLLALVLALLTMPTLPAGAADGEGQRMESVGRDGPEGAIGLQLLEVPVSRQDDPRARIYIVDHLAPGTSIQRKVLLSNSTGLPADVSLYDAAAEIKNGVFTGSPGRTANELSIWTSLDTTGLTLAPSGTSEVTVSIAVPEDAAEGERLGVVWAEVSSNDAGAGSVTAVNRVGIRIYLSVGPGGEPASDVEIESMAAARNPQSLPVVRALVRNTGGRSLDLSGELSLSDGPGGLVGGPFQTNSPTTLLPGQSGQLEFVLDRQLPAGPWKARLEVFSGLLRETVEADITFPSDANAVNAPVPAELPGLNWITGAAIILFLLVFAALMLLVLRHRRRNRLKALPPSFRNKVGSYLS